MVDFPRFQDFWVVILSIHVDSILSHPCFVGRICRAKLGNYPAAVWMQNMCITLEGEGMNLAQPHLTMK